MHLFHCSRASRAHRLRACMQAGFTLIEAMVVIAITAILTALAAPSMRNLIESNGVTDSAESLMSTMSFARAEAIKRGATVTICPSDAAKTNTVACGSSDLWSVGWLVFVDYTGDGSLDAKDTVLRVFGSFEKNGSIANERSYLSFKSTGTISGLAGSFAFKTPSGANVVKMVCHSSGGRLRVANGEKC